jgi:hypothetical protein
MADTDIPAPLLAAQRAFDGATAALMAAPKDMPVEERRALREAELAAMWHLREARAGTEWDTVSGQKQLRAAAQGDSEA